MPKPPPPPPAPAPSVLLGGLNPEQLAAVTHGDGPLLIIAGAGTGKTKTLVHRVAHLIERGADPRRLLLLTFTRRAAAEMLRRVDELLGLGGRPGAPGAATGSASVATWGGTFHAVGARLLRMHGKAIGLDPNFTIHDRGDSEDLLEVVRTELGIVATEKRFPRKATCMSIYSHAVNAQKPLEPVLAAEFPWCRDWADELKRLFRAFAERKEKLAVLDYDDLLLHWRESVADPREGERVRERFDRVLVDEYQDTNRLQAELLALLRPGGQGLTAVGDDAQSIYSFRAATVRNILDFPSDYPGTTVVKLEQNYRSTVPILEATNAVLGEAAEGFRKTLRSDRVGGEKPALVVCEDEVEQAMYVVRRVLERRDRGMDLRRQAVLFRAAHHSIALEAELGRAQIPFVKYGGLKFLETAHVKDLLGFLRLAENPRDIISGMRVLTLLPGVGPKRAHALVATLASAGGDFAAWAGAPMPPDARKSFTGLVKLMKRLRAAPPTEVPASVAAARKFYIPLAEEKFDNAAPRLRDLEQIEGLSARYPDRRTMLAELALDPPASTGDLAQPPHKDDDWLVLSTIHSAKGLEWDAVYVIHASDGNIPSDMATDSKERIEEERRLFYVALTRARTWLAICYPLRYYHAARSPWGDDHSYGQLTRFITAKVKKRLKLETAVATPGTRDETGEGNPAGSADSSAARVRKRLGGLWS